MLQVKDLVKKYVTGGETVVALNHVSVDFPERGMVFLLGKSGSGKSTLLNVSGGLDSPDEGEIIVKGRSSKAFSHSDFDSYRNTYVGFIFQEYNILSELTVAENVALALELQGKPRDDARIAELLREVDLEGYGDRRPNTLSGGQKQRVAIARALVKNPEIIMADEPTGALDSKTGAQVFDTLRKLSENKLVIVVSHDREFAEVYADRIIELKDGEIVSDVSRTGEQREAARKNLCEIGEKKLAVANGAALTSEEEAKILDFVRKTRGGVVISSEDADLAALPEEHTAAGFSETHMAPVSAGKDETHFIKSDFPLRYALKMGFAGLKLKPVRLAFTALLATIAFIVFGVFSTLLTYDPEKLGARTLTDANYSAAVLEKFGVAHMYSETEGTYTRKIYTGASSSPFSAAEIERIRADYPEMHFFPAFTFNQTLTFGSTQARTDEETKSDYYDCIGDFTAIAYASDAAWYFESGTFSLVAGEMPAARTEILISVPVFETFAQYGYGTGNDRVTIAEPAEMLGKSISIYMGAGSSLPLTVVGIFDAHDDFSAHAFLKEGNVIARAPEGNVPPWQQQPQDTLRYPAEVWSEYQDDFTEEFRWSMSSVAFAGDGLFEAYSGYDSFYGQRTNHNGGIAREFFRSSNYFEASFGPWTPFTVKAEYEPEGSYQQYLFGTLTGGRAKRSAALMALDGREDSATDIDYEAPYAFMRDIRENDALFHRLLVILGPVSAALAVFAALLLFNFISASINAKRKDIGILRAVGARGIDVFKIFMTEGIAITAACFVLGSLGAFAACAIVNAVLMRVADFSFGMFCFDWINALIVFAIAFTTSVFSTAVPVALTAKKKPIEAIRAV